MSFLVSSSQRALVSCALLVLVMAAACSKSPLEFTVTFKDARSLSQGHAVLLNGVKIGEVTRIALDPAGTVEVGVRIEPEHTSRVFRESTFTIEKPGGLTDVSGERGLVVKNESPASTPVKAGDIVRGTEGFFGDLLGKAKAAASAATSWGSDAASGLGEQLKALGESPEVRQFLQDSSARAAEAGKSVSEEARKVYRERRIVLFAEAERLRDELQKKANKDEATRFWEEFQRWAKEHLPE